MSAKHSFAQTFCIKKAGLAMQATHAIWPGCRIGVAVSGGVDSLTLLQVLTERKKILPFPIEIMAIHLNPGFQPDDHGQLGNWLANKGIPAHIEITDYGPRAHSCENRKNSPCFYCAWLRRKRLFNLCREYRLTHLAFGHNAEDMASTFLLNLLKNARVQGMGMNESFFNGALKVIRPLLLVEKKYIRQAARQWALPFWQNACPTSGHSARSDMWDILMDICLRLPGARRSLINGLSRWQLQMDSCTEAKAGLIAATNANNEKQYEIGF